MHPRPTDPLARKLAILGLAAMVPLPMLVGIVAGAAGADGGQFGVATFMVSSAVTVLLTVVYGLHATARNRFRYREALADPERVARAGPPSMALLARAFVYSLLGLPLSAASFGAYHDSAAGDTGHAIGVAFFFVLGLLAWSAAASSVSRYLLHRQAWRESVMLGEVKARKLRTHGR